MAGLFDLVDGTVVEVDGTRYRYVAGGGIQRWQALPPHRTYRNSGRARQFAAALDRIAELEAQVTS